MLSTDTSLQKSAQSHILQLPRSPGASVGVPREMGSGDPVSSLQTRCHHRVPHASHWNAQPGAQPRPSQSPAETQGRARHGPQQKRRGRGFKPSNALPPSRGRARDHSGKGAPWPLRPPSGPVERRRARVVLVARHRTSKPNTKSSGGAFRNRLRSSPKSPPRQPRSRGRLGPERRTTCPSTSRPPSPLWAFC